MILNVLKNTVLLCFIILISCGSDSKKLETRDDKNIIVGANQIDTYLPLLKDKRVGIVANQTSVIFTLRQAQASKLHTHLVDSLISLKVDVKTVFAPEHGFRGKADAGEIVKDGIDSKTGLPIVSLYGDSKKPKLERLAETQKLEEDIETGVSKIDIMIFDLQDVGVRFYTYAATLHYVMEACAEANIPLIVLDRPNPNGHYLDGPILEAEHKSFVGMHPIPVAHGMTIGEYAKMINGEGWLANGIQCDITVIPLKYYSHNSAYSLPIKPSPNLPNDKAINLYPSLCFFEGTNVSAGRGTNKQFQIFGSPFLDKEKYNFEFTPQPNEGSKYPKHKGVLCYGLDLKNNVDLNLINLDWLITTYNNTEDKSIFFNTFFVKLAGTQILQQQIEQGLTEAQIRATWQEGLDTFKITRLKYLLYE